MLNLIVKDILIQKKIFLFGFIYIVLIMISFQQSGSTMFGTSVVAFTYILIQSACAYDDKNKSDVLLNSLPISRVTIVSARYVSIFIFAAIATAYYLIISVIIRASGLPIQIYVVTFESVLGVLFALLLISSIYLPIFFKVGYIKSKTINFIVFFIVFFGGTVYLQDLAKKDVPFVRSALEFISRQSDTTIAAALIAVMVLMLVVSYCLALHNYRKREF